jgi:homogentisate 1,2-dioxygenase
MRRFNTVGSLSWDHPDPSIFCALTSPSHDVMGANVDLLILPPRWVVAEHSFRPPGFHRNAAAEFLGLITGSHDSRNSGFPPGSMSLHNNWTAHGPDLATLDAGQAAELKPQKIEDSMVFMLETRFPFQHSAAAMNAPNRQTDCAQGWAGFQRRFPA